MYQDSYVKLILLINVMFILYMFIFSAWSLAVIMSYKGIEEYSQSSLYLEATVHNIETKS